MILRKFIILATIIVMSTQFAFANYAFYRKVSNTCKFYRVSIDEKKMSLTKNEDGSYHFTIEMESLRNNFEMVMLVGYNALVPGNTEVTVMIPVSRQSTIITAKATADQIRQLSDGKVDTAGFMRLIKDSIQTL